MTTIDNITDLTFHIGYDFIEPEHLTDRNANSYIGLNSYCELIDNEYHINVEFPIEDEVYQHKYKLDGEFGINIDVSALLPYGNTLVRHTLAESGYINIQTLKKLIRDDSFTRSMRLYNIPVKNNDKSARAIIDLYKTVSGAYIHKAEIIISEIAGNIWFINYRKIVNQTKL